MADVESTKNVTLFSFLFTNPNPSNDPDDNFINIIKFLRIIAKYDSTRPREDTIWLERDPNYPLDSSDIMSASGTNSAFSNYPTSTPASMSSNDAYTDKLLKFIAYKLLLPIVIILVGICLILGITLIIKSYMMKPLKQNLATAIRRRRRTGHAPDNQYIPPEEIRASIHSAGRGYERKSLPPPEVLMAARARASEIYHV